MVNLVPIESNLRFSAPTLCTVSAGSSENLAVKFVSHDSKEESKFSVLENNCPFTHSEAWLPELLPPDNASSNRLPGREPAPFNPEHAASPAAYKPVNHRDQLPITALPHSSVAIPPRV